MLKKRLLSSPLAFFRSIEWHKYAIENNLDAITDEKLLNRITQLAKEDYSDDNEKEQNEEIAIIETSKVMAKLSEEEKNILNKLIDISRDLKFKADEKAKSLLKFKWENKKIFFTGAMGQTRSELQKQAKAHGISVSSSVSSKTDFLIIGENVGQSKLKAAKVNDVVILTEEEYLNKLNKK